MGGVALAAAVDALELASSQTLLWSNIQFLAPTTHAEELLVSCEQCGGGQSVGQWLAEIRSNGRVTHRVNAALGAREPSEQRVFSAMPDVPAPDDCAPGDRGWGVPGTLGDQLDIRIAMEDEERGLQALWSRSQAGFKADSGWLAIVSDFFLGAHPATRGGSSLDDTFRFIQGCDDGWVLSVTEFAAFDRGVVHGSAKHFSQDGRLLAISSQSGVLPRIPRTP
nr:acyl-CoA thioesterase domain-containing protein [Qipengyuania flava]